MNQITDLHIVKQILPLFDSTTSEKARDKLIGLFTEIPASIEEIYSRQQILKVLLKHPALMKPFRYSRAELEEVYESTMKNQNRQALLEKRDAFSFSRVSVKLMQREKGKIVQIVSFFKRMYDAYFAELDLREFPVDFHQALENIVEIFHNLEIDKYDDAMLKKLWKKKTLLVFMKLMDEKVRTGKLAEFWHTVFLFEAYLSIARTVHRYDMRFPTFTDARLLLEDFYFPLIASPVKNSIEVNAGVTLLTGPNMSGKSTLLRSLGLCVFLAHLGIAVPALKCEMTFYDSIAIAVNLNDDVEKGYSHFMTEVLTLKSVLAEAVKGKKCFAVFDELFRGTNGEDALAISEMTIAGLHRFTDSCFIISTHLHQLREKIEKNVKVDMKHLECRLLGDRPVFTYQLKEGWSDVKIGQLIFKREGLTEILSGG